MEAEDHLCTRSAAIILQDGQLLLTGHTDAAGMFFWTFPGGLTCDDETPEECAVRQAWEETGLDVVVEHLVYDLAWDLPVGCTSELYYLVRPTGGTLTSANDPCVEGDQPRPLLWVPCQDITDFPFRPGELKRRLPDDAERRFRGAPYQQIRFRD